MTSIPSRAISVIFDDLDPLKTTISAIHDGLAPLVIINIKATINDLVPLDGTATASISVMTSIPS